MDAQASDPMIPRLCRVKNVTRDTVDTFTLELTPPEGNGKFAFGPGQFNMVYAFGVGEVPISISSDPQAATFLHTTRAVGAVTQAICRLKRGAALGIRGPFGTSWPTHEVKGKDVVVVAGGIGLAPLRPAVYHYLSHRENYGKVALLYGARTPEDMLYPREIEKWRTRSSLETHVTVDRATSSWRGNVGVVTTLIPKTTIDPFNAVALVCGPEIMMRFTIQALQKSGLEPSSIYVSMERNMKCGIGTCGHCQCGPFFICKDGPVFTLDRVQEIFGKREI